MKFLRHLRWYLRELTGEAEYDRFVQRHAVAHPGEPLLTRREYERHRVARLETPGSRCC
ncbi:MAG TPA: hypothetical protein DGT23_17690 [Micromonosporaceae bacterium]|nr:hypothetical protein [Micromonosporaceae bacterium]